MKSYHQIAAKSNGSSLIEHLKLVGIAAIRIASAVGMDPILAQKGAHLHDIGKASPIFQSLLLGSSTRAPGFVFRHEIASLFFLSLISDPNERKAVIEMIVAHHKSVENDARKKGFLDLEDELDSFKIHSSRFEEWQEDALSILKDLGWKNIPNRISIQEARDSYNEAIDYCEGLDKRPSSWKGLLMAADHMASALEEGVQLVLPRLFRSPDLKYYQNRQSELYPLSLLPADDPRPHSIITAPTGAGKTDYLLRRCRGRVFYTLPFQASINAMYERLKKDLAETDAEIQLLHAASFLKLEGQSYTERILPRHVGASIKVLTPHQLVGIAFGLKGYEALAIDLQGSDLILDEIHTYSELTQAMVLKLIEALLALSCRIHVGTATMPSLLYKQIHTMLGAREQVFELKLPQQQLSSFNRHIVHKLDSFADADRIIERAINEGKKILIVCNRIDRAQAIYSELKEAVPELKKMLIHSRFKRGDRAALEELLQVDFNRSEQACIVVSTQVVEVSLDISFDLMITEAAPIDALIQRFGRINRKRSPETIGKYKEVYVIAVPSEQKDAYPYELETLQRSFETLPDGGLLEESKIQELIDKVYPELPLMNIDLHSIYAAGEWTLKALVHHPRSALFDILEIDSACCIVESDKERYETANYCERSKLEIPVSYKAIAFKNLERSEIAMHPFLIPDQAYDSELGYLKEKADPSLYKRFDIL